MRVWGYLMTQYNLKPGLQKFRERGTTTAISELTQLHVMDTWSVMDPTKLTRDDRTKALSSLLFLKEKWCRKIQGQACVNRVPQRAYIPKKDAVLQTASTELMFITLAIAASEMRLVQLRRAADILQIYYRRQKGHVLDSGKCGDCVEMS